MSTEVAALIVTVVLSIIGAALWLGALHAKVSALRDRVDNLECVADQVGVISGDMRAVVTKLEVIQEDLHNRRQGRGGD